jgi:hypothetical protein
MHHNFMFQLLLVNLMVALGASIISPRLLDAVNYIAGLLSIDSTGARIWRDK